MKLGATSLSVTKPGSARQYAASSGGSSNNTLPDIDTYSHVRFDVINTTSADCYDVQVKSDGTKLYTLERISSTNCRLKQQDLSTAYDISTHGNTTSSLDTNIFQPNGLTFTFFFGDNGNKLYLGGIIADVTQIDLATPWDISSNRTVVRTVDVGTRVNGLYWKPDGTVLYYADDVDNKIYSKTVSTPWDLSTITSTGTSVDLSLASNTAEAAPYGIRLSNDGLKLFIVGSINDKVYQYNLTTAWDISSFSGAADKELSVTNQETAPVGLDFSSDGTHLYIAGLGDNGIDQYTSS
jgi:hypothetical protein